ncbi:hypothetical protein BaRGS_00031523 [Batillaria attramentaria]|uniref:Uncharacterized protein n=1 Tax=Batillaria attramentaria TaxID=370345 RepID=A0ABD0JRQ7_9CAEN
MVRCSERVPKGPQPSLASGRDAAQMMSLEFCSASNRVTVPCERLCDDYQRMPEPRVQLHSCNDVPIAQWYHQTTILAILLDSSAAVLNSSIHCPDSLAVFTDCIHCLLLRFLLQLY